MKNDDLTELHAQLHGLRLVLAMVIQSLPPGHDLEDRLDEIEEHLRRQNALSGTIEIVRFFRNLT
ncbi:hypothetical protein ASG25_10605 [Rhizobium sp. Leaf384]|uniref:hypothetical protein n=1 Tax=Rhizobium sp. Leaf384 TaxID=1736358 RepID=UPI000715A81C|nr:hypothetical protein [Rhizobium sp. Leaf384]KQS79028.1 hypothetical protein ASG25_10605 [Rhizobium sp. Leaf384]